MKSTVKMQVFYIDGTNQTFEWEAEQEQQPFTGISDFKKSINEQVLIIKTVDDELILINKNNVKYIEVNAAPDKMPSEAIVGVRKI